MQRQKRKASGFDQSHTFWPKALELWQRESNERVERMTMLRDRFERELLRGYPAAIVIGASAPRLPHTSNIAFVELDRPVSA